MAMRVYMLNRFLNRVLLQPIVKFLKQGLTPDKLSLCFAMGITLGTFPVLGSTTLLCTLAVFIFRLNMPAILFVNYFVYPLQLILFIPFIRAGEFLFHQTPIPLDIVLIFSMLKEDMVGTIQSLWWTNMHAIVAWFVFALPIGVGVYYGLIPIFNRFKESGGHAE
jgi:uncharacterized protein (DUF2062 family)